MNEPEKAKKSAKTGKKCNFKHEKEDEKRGMRTPKNAKNMFFETGKKTQKDEAK